MSDRNKTLDAKPQLVALDELQTPFARNIINPKKLAELEASLIQHGQLEPIHVSARMVVMSGNTRVGLLRKNGRTTVLAIIHAEITDEQGELAFLFATDTKSDRHPVDQAFLVADTRAKYGLTWQEVAKRLGLSPATVSRLKSISEQSPEVHEAMRRGELGVLQVMEIKNAAPDRQIEIMKRAIDGKLNPEEIRALVRPKKGAKRKPVILRFGSILLTAPADMMPTLIRDTLQGGLFPAVQKAAGLNLKADALPAIIAGLNK